MKKEIEKLIEKYELEESEVKDCTTCKYGYNFPDREPCRSCSKEFSSWQSSRAIIKP
jgi:recombinational DNA repair protein RecR